MNRIMNMREDRNNFDSDKIDIFFVLILPDDLNNIFRS